MTRSVARNIEHTLRKQRAVGDHRTTIGGKFGQPVDEILVAGPLRLQDLEPELAGPVRNRARRELLAAPAWGVGSRDHSEQLMAGIGKRIQ